MRPRLGSDVARATYDMKPLFDVAFIVGVFALFLLAVAVTEKVHTYARLLRHSLRGDFTKSRESAKAEISTVRSFEDSPAEIPGRLT